MLPIEQILPELHQQLVKGDGIVVAPPGAGKSTALPLSLLSHSTLSQSKVIMLQPRRVAARNIAHYLAKQLGEPVGQTVGYRIKGDTKVSVNTRLEIVTEGVLTRMLQTDPELDGIGLVIFDEFHERSIHADFALALCLEVQQALRDDLRLLVMSATLDTDPVQRLMPMAKLCHSEGKHYPVDIVYRGDTRQVPLSDKVTRLTLDVLPKHEGDCLVFLPGAADIHSVADKLGRSLSNEWVVHCLYSSLDKHAQDAALAIDKQGRRKVVLATNIAETSLTIEGIQVVIDSGIEKSAVFDLNLGVNQLKRQFISQAAATQRAGRAGRLGPGTCYRLWSEEHQGRMLRQSTPEILQTDISSFILDAAVWGTAISELNLIDQPSAGQLSQGYEYLQQLNLLDKQRRITQQGQQAHRLGCQASVANMLLKAQSLSQGHVSLACAVAALLDHKDPLGFDQGAQMSLRLEFLLAHRHHYIWQDVRVWHKKLNCSIQAWPLEDLGLLLVSGFAQWVGRKSHSERYLLVNGSGVLLNKDDPLVVSQWLVVTSMLNTDKAQNKVRVIYAEALSVELVEASFSKRIEWRSHLYWDQSKQLICAQQQQTLGNIVMASRPIAKADVPNPIAIWQQVIADKGVMNLPLDQQTLQLIYRIRLARAVLSEMVWPNFDEQALLDNLADWLGPYLADVYSWQQLSKLSFYRILSAQLDWDAQNQLDQLLPKSIKVPSGSQIKLDYTQSGQVKLSVRMQEVYGLKDTPTLAKGKLAIQMELLSPAGRPIQTTQDLAGFWQGSYKAVQKEMKGRYQKHFWPDNPQDAVATTRTKKKMIGLP